MVDGDVSKGQESVVESRDTSDEHHVRATAEDETAATDQTDQTSLKLGRTGLGDGESKTAPDQHIQRSHGDHSVATVIDEVAKESTPARQSGPSIATETDTREQDESLAPSQSASSSAAISPSHQVTPSHKKV